MPTYDYVCDACDHRFEEFQSITASAKRKCPECGRSCHRVFSSFAAGRSTKGLLSPENLERHGFTQYQRAGGGYYEKTCGKGPDVIRR